MYKLKSSNIFEYINKISYTYKNYIELCLLIISIIIFCSSSFFSFLFEFFVRCEVLLYHVESDNI